MAQFSITYCIQFYIVSIIIVIDTIPSIIAEEITLQNATDDHGFYENCDEIVILNKQNLHNYIYGSNKSWVVEYYNKKDNSSILFQSVWIQLATNFQFLRDIGVGAYECTHNYSEPECDFEVTKSTPIIKYYSPYSKPGSLGIQIETSFNEKKLRTDMINLMTANHSDDNNENHKIISSTQYSIYIILISLVLILVLVCIYIIIKRKTIRNINVYTILHKSEINDEDRY